jgi:hypothetical protein
MGTGKERLGIEIGGWWAPGKSSAWCRGSGSRVRCRGATEGVGPASSKEVCNAASSSSAEEDRGVAAVKGGDGSSGTSDAGTQCGSGAVNYRCFFWFVCVVGRSPVPRRLALFTRGSVKPAKNPLLFLHI